MRKISKSRMRRYRVMRLLFRSSGLGFNEIFREGEFSIKIELINVLVYLERNRLITKTRDEKGTIYSLTERGEARLAHYEFTYVLYQKWKPKWCLGEANQWHDDYCAEMANIIRSHDCFGYENVG